MDAKNLTLEFGLIPQGFAINTFTLDASTDKLEYIFQAPGAITITHLGFRGASNTASPPTYRISLQGVLAASGFPDGTVKGGVTPASATFSNPSTTEWTWVALTNSYTTTAGEFLALVIEHSSGTIGASNNTGFYASWPVWGQRFPVSINNNAGTRTRDAAPGIRAYKTSTTVYGLPLKTATIQNFTASSNPGEYGIKFKLESAYSDTYKIRAVKIAAQFNIAASESSNVILYSGTTTLPANSTGAVTETTIRQQVTFDHDFAAASEAMHIIEFTDNPLPTLYFGATYRLMLRAATGSNGMNLRYMEVSAQNDWTAFPGGSDVIQSTRAFNSGNFTDVATKRPCISLILADITEAAAGGIPQGLHTIEEGICA